MPFLPVCRMPEPASGQLGDVDLRVVADRDHIRQIKIAVLLAANRVSPSTTDPNPHAGARRLARCVPPAPDPPWIRVSQATNPSHDRRSRPSFPGSAPSALPLPLILPRVRSA